MHTPVVTVPALARRFQEDEYGGGSAFALFLFMALLLIGGLSVDGTNAWRHMQLMQQTADVAAHAGVVRIAEGDGEGDVHTAAVNAVQLNMPTDSYGQVFSNTATDVVLLNYDPVTNTVSTTGRINAVGVTVHRSDEVSNPVGTIMLRIADLASGWGDNPADLSSWNLRVGSISAVVATQRCSSTDGIYAQDQINITSSNDFGPGYCLHSQAEVWMPQQNTFAPTAGISMPDLADCADKCTDASNPGSTAASFETNLLLPDLAAHIANMELAFTDTGNTYPEHQEFFAGKFLDGDLSPLSAAGVNTNGLTTGSVVTLTQNQFESLSRIPTGLVYEVNCTANGNGPNTRLTIDSSNGGNNLEDVAIVTNCSIDFGSTADVTGSLILTTRVATSATVNASSGASIGDTLGSCDLNTKSYVLATSDLSVPADFAGSNVSFIIDGDIHLSASSSSSTIDHSGVSFHSSQEIHISANHQFDSCNLPPSGIMPELRVIRHVVPFDTPVVVATN